MSDNQYKIIDKQIDEKTRQTGKIESSVAIPFRTPSEKPRTGGARETLWSVKHFVADKTHCGQLIPYTSGEYTYGQPLHKMSECDDNSYCYNNNWGVDCPDGRCTLCSGYLESVYWAPHPFDFFEKALDRNFLSAGNEGMVRIMRPRYELVCYSTEVYRDTAGIINLGIQTDDSVAVYLDGQLKYSSEYTSPNTRNSVDLTVPSGVWNKIDVYHYCPYNINGINVGNNLCEQINKSRYPVMPSGIKWDDGFPTKGTYPYEINLSWHWASGIDVPDNTLVKVMASGTSIGLDRWTILDLVADWETHEYIHKGLSSDRIVYYKIVPMTPNGDAGQPSAMASGSTGALYGPRMAVINKPYYYYSADKASDKTFHFVSGDSVDFTITSSVPLSVQPISWIEHLNTSTRYPATFVGITNGMPSLGHAYQSCDFTVTISGAVKTEGMYEIGTSGIAVGNEGTNKFVTIQQAGTSLEHQFILDFTSPVGDVAISQDDINPQENTGLLVGPPPFVYTHKRMVFLYAPTGASPPHFYYIGDPKPADSYNSGIGYMRFASSKSDILLTGWEEYSNGYNRQYLLPDVQGSGWVYAQYMDRAGNFSTIESGGYILDTVAPEAPRNLTVSNNLVNRIYTDWDSPLNDSDVWYYKLYRYSDNPGVTLGINSPYIEAEWPKTLNATTYNDDNFINEDVAKWYSVTAFDFAGNESDHVGPVSGHSWNAIPNIPEIQSVGFGVKYSVEQGQYDTYATSQWDEVSDAAYYEAALYKTSEGSDNAAIVRVPYYIGVDPVVTWHFIDAGEAPDFQEYECTIRAISAYGNPSDWSDISGGTAYPDLIPPPQIDNLTANAIKGAVNLSWDAIVVNDRDDYVVFREDMLVSTETVFSNMGRTAKTIGINDGAIIYDPTGAMVVIYTAGGDEDAVLCTGYVDEGVWTRFLFDTPLLYDHIVGETVEVYTPLGITKSNNWMDSTIAELASGTYNVKARDKAGNMGPFASTWVEAAASPGKLIQHIDLTSSRTWGSSVADFVQNHPVPSGNFINPFVFSTDWINIGTTEGASGVAANESVMLNIDCVERYTSRIDTFHAYLVNSGGTNVPYLDINNDYQPMNFMVRSNWLGGTGSFYRKKWRSSFGVKTSNKMPRTLTQTPGRFYVASGYDYQSPGGGASPYTRVFLDGYPLDSTYPKYHPNDKTLVQIYAPQSEKTIAQRIKPPSSIPSGGLMDHRFCAQNVLEASGWRYYNVAYYAPERTVDVLRLKEIDTSGTYVKVHFYAYVLYESNKSHLNNYYTEPCDWHCIDINWSWYNGTKPFYASQNPFFGFIPGLTWGPWYETEFYCARIAPAELWEGGPERRGFRGIADMGGITDVTISIFP